MTRYLTTVILLGLAIALGAYLVLVDNPRQQKKDAEQERANRIVALNEGDVTAMELISPSGTIALERADDGAWRLTRPVVDEVDDGEIRRLLTQLTTLSPVRAIDQLPDLSEVGLQDPPLRVVARTASGTTELAFGLPSPAGSGVYVRRDDGRVFLADLSAKSNFETDLQELRRKEFLDFDPQQITAIAITEQGRTTRLVRNSHVWSIADPPVPADPEKATSLLSRLRALRTNAFFDTPNQRRAVKLQPSPKVSIELSAGEQGLPVKFYAARNGPPGTLYVRTGEDELYQISDTLLTEMPLRLAELRDLRLVRIPAEEIRAVSVTTPTDDYRVVKQGDDWEFEERVLEPDAERRITDLLDAVVRLKASSVAAESLAAAPAGVFDKPIAEIALEGSAQELLATVTIGALSGERRYARSAPSGPVFLVDANVVNRIPTRSDLQAAKPAG